MQSRVEIKSSFCFSRKTASSFQEIFELFCLTSPYFSKNLELEVYPALLFVCLLSTVKILKRMDEGTFDDWGVKVSSLVHRLQPIPHRKISSLNQRDFS